MSHIVDIDTEVRDAVAAAAGCQRLGWAAPIQGTAKMYSSRATGLQVKFPGWRYPAVFDLATGKAKIDNFGGRWGKQEQFDKFVQAYAVEKAKIEARKQGNLATEQLLADGSIKVTVQVGGGA